MAISIDYNVYPYIINVPKSDTTFIDFDPINGRERRSMDINSFRLQLDDWNDDPENAWAPDTHVNTVPNDIGSIVLGRALTITNDYRVQFEDGQYSVSLLGANSNISSFTIVNGVLPIPNNTVGLAQISVGSGLSVQEQTMLLKIYQVLQLDPNAPVTTTETQTSFDDVVITHVGDPEVQIISTRQP
jgi:hypothetical protein